MIIRSSSLPKLSQCIHYEGEEIQSETATRGHEFHNRMRNYYNDPFGDSTPLDAAMEFCIDFIDKNIPQIEGIEKTLKLFGYGSEIIYTPTVDLWGYGHHGEIIVVDYKTGNYQESYYYQMCEYALALMQASGEKECTIVILYVDLKKAWASKIGYSKAETESSMLRARVLKGEAAPKINSFCQYCKKKATCQAYNKETSYSLASVGENSLKIEGLEAGIAELKANPVKLEKFLFHFKKIEDMIEHNKLSETLKAAIESGQYEGEYFSVSQCQGAVSMEAKDAFALLPELGAEGLAPFIKVGKVRELAAKCAELFPDKKLNIKYGSPYTQLKRKPTKKNELQQQ